MCSVMSDSSPPRGLWSLPGSSVHGVVQARIVKWVAVSFSKGITPAQGWNTYLVSPALARRFFTTAPFGKPNFFSESIIIFRNFKIRKKVFYIVLCIYRFQSSALTCVVTNIHLVTFSLCPENFS